MEYGTFVGLGWGALFLCYVGCVCTGSALLMLLCMAVGAACLVLPFRMALRMNRKLQAIGEKMSYLQGLLFAISMLMYACLMNGLVNYVYFAYFDDGALLDQMTQLMTQANTRETYRQMGMSASYAQMEAMLDEIGNLSPFEKTLSLFNSNFLCSIILSFFVALSASCRLKASGATTQNQK